MSAWSLVVAPVSAQQTGEERSTTSGRDASALQTHTDAEPPPDPASTAVSSRMSASDPGVLASLFDVGQVLQPPAGPPPTPHHTGIKAMAKGLIVDFKYLPSPENAMWAGVGGGLALAFHPLDDNVTNALVGNNTAEKFFKPGAVLGALPTLLGGASIVYVVGRVKDEPKVSHVGMDLIQAIAMSEIVTETLKYATRRERPDQSGRTSFPSGHAADTFAFATALERHLGWRYAVPAYTVASYVAMSRLPANRHWLSDVVFGSAVGIIAGRTVTSHEAQSFPVAVNYIPGGVAVMYVRRGQ
jgi:membrane-associated phospholipid phosphatase